MSPTPEEVRALIEHGREQHEKHPGEQGSDEEFCRDCEADWPCPAWQALDALEALEAERARCPENAGRHNSNYLRCVYHQGHAGPHWASGSKWLEVDEDTEELQAQRDALAALLREAVPLVWKGEVRRRLAGVLAEHGLEKPCCDRHGRACEPPSELCCARCTEAMHPSHADGSACSSPDLEKP